MIVFLLSFDTIKVKKKYKEFEKEREAMKEQLLSGNLEENGAKKRRRYRVFFKCDNKEEKTIAYDVTNIRNDVRNAFMMATNDINRKHGCVISMDDRVLFTVTHVDEKNIVVELSLPKKLSCDGQQQMASKLFRRGVKMYIRTQIYNYAGVFW